MDFAGQTINAHAKFKVTDARRGWKIHHENYPQKFVFEQNLANLWNILSSKILGYTVQPSMRCYIHVAVHLLDTMQAANFLLSVDQSTTSVHICDIALAVAREIWWYCPVVSAISSGFLNCVGGALPPPTPTPWCWTFLPMDIYYMHMYLYNSVCKAQYDLYLMFWQMCS